MLCYYDARIGISDYAGMFNPITRKPFALYYAFKAFNELYKMENQVECQYDNKSNGIYALAAANNDKRAVMISNPTEKEVSIETNIDDMRVYIVDDTRTLEQTKCNR